MAADTQYVSNFNIPGLNLYINPLYHGYLDQTMMFDGELIRSVNIDSYPLGSKQKRPGYVTFLGTSQSGGSAVQSLFSWTQDNGTSIWLYNYQNNVLCYYDVAAGTATDWIPCQNGTFSGTHVGYAILGNTLICGDGMSATRHTTNGTTFTNTVLAPMGEFFAQYQNRVYIGGTSSTLFYSTTNDATNWQIAGTSDSSSFTIPDAGKIGRIFVLASQLLIGKNSGKMFRWDGFNLYDMASNQGPTSPYSYDSVEGNGFWLNNLGIFTSQGDTPQLISNPIQRQIYNDAGLGIAGTVFGTAQGKFYKYDYFLSVGSTQDDFTNEPLNNTIIKYNFQKNEFLNYQFNDNPTCFTSYRDANGVLQFLFGNSTGQVFQYGGTATSDNGAPIYSVMEMVFNFNQPHLDKEWRWFWGFFNPGCEAQIQFATTDTFTRTRKNWIDLGDTTEGIAKYRFPMGSRSKLLWIRIRDNSMNARFTLHGITIGGRLVDPG